MIRFIQLLKLLNLITESPSIEQSWSHKNCDFDQLRKTQYRISTEAYRSFTSCYTRSI